MNFVERENPVNRQTIKKCAKSNDYVTWHKTCLNNNMSEIINYWILSAWSEKNCRCWAAKYLYSEHNDKIGGRTFRIGDLNLFCSYDLLPTKTPPFLFAFASPREKKKVSTKLHSTKLGTSLIWKPTSNHLSNLWDQHKPQKDFHGPLCLLNLFTILSAYLGRVFWFAKGKRITPVVFWADNITLYDVHCHPDGKRK